MKQLYYIFYSELILQLRHSQKWLYPLCFYGMTICLLPFIFPHIDQVTLQSFIPGYFWLAALFANLLAIQTIFLTDLEDGHLEQLLLSQLPLSAIIAVKIAAQWIITQLPLIIITPVLSLLFQMPNDIILLLCFTYLLGTPILTLLGSFAVALTIGLQQPGIFLGLLILPLATPVLIFGVNIIQQALIGMQVNGPLCFLAGLSILSITLLPWVIASVIAMAAEE